MSDQLTDRPNGRATAADGDDDHGGPAPSPPTEVVGAEHPRATPADAARTIVANGRHAMLATITDRPPGYPFGSLVSYALDDAGHPLVVISTMAEHTRNAGRDGRASLLVAESPTPPDGNHGGHGAAAESGHDPLDAGRVTLVGQLRPVEPTEQAAATARVVEAVPAVGGYAHFRDFSCWRLEVEAVRWVGGFGSMGWVEAVDYLAAVPDPVLARRRGILDHMNADHADACLDIVGHALGRRDLVAARMVAVDRFGCDYQATAGDSEVVAIRVPFAAAGVAGDVDDVRRQLVAQTHAARRATSGPDTPAET